MNNGRVHFYFKEIMILFSITVFWILYSALYFYFEGNLSSLVSGYFSLVGQSGLDLLIVFFCYLAWEKANGNLKKFFFLLGSAFLAAFISDFSYNYILNVEKMPVNNFLDSLFDIPFSISLFLQMLAWFFLFLKSNTGQFKNYLPYLIASIAIFFCFMFGVRWEIKYFSPIGIYQIIDTLFEAVGFMLASFCLVSAKKIWIKYLSSGYLIVLSSDFIIRYSVVKSNILINNPFETTWVFGLLLIFSGFFLLEKNR